MEYEVRNTDILVKFSTRDVMMKRTSYYPAQKIVFDGQNKLFIVTAHGIEIYHLNICLSFFKRIELGYYVTDAELKGDNLFIFSKQYTGFYNITKSLFYMFRIIMRKNSPMIDCVDTHEAPQYYNVGPFEIPIEDKVIYYNEHGIRIAIICDGAQGRILHAFITKEGLVVIFDAGYIYLVKNNELYAEKIHSTKDIIISATYDGRHILLTTIGSEGIIKYTIASGYQKTSDYEHKKEILSYQHDHLYAVSKELIFRKDVNSWRGLARRISDQDCMVMLVDKDSIYIPVDGGIEVYSKGIGVLYQLENIPKARFIWKRNELVYFGDTFYTAIYNTLTCRAKVISIKGDISI